MNGEHWRSRLVAHRGASHDFPENTLLAIDAALRAGVRAVEFDVQISADGVPFVIHDPVLMRTTGRRGRVDGLDAKALDAISAHEPARFGERFAPEPIPRLSAVIERLNRDPRCLAFVEVKRHALRGQGTRQALRQVVAALRAARFEWVLISFDADAIETLGELGHANRGWVLRSWDAAHRARAEAMAPAYLFVNVEKVGDQPLWPGPWQWVVYELGRADAVRRWLARGADLVETNSTIGLFADDRPG